MRRLGIFNKVLIGFIVFFILNFILFKILNDYRVSSISASGFLYYVCFIILFNFYKNLKYYIKYGTPPASSYFLMKIHDLGEAFSGKIKYDGIKKANVLSIVVYIILHLSIFSLLFGFIYYALIGFIKINPISLNLFVVSIFLFYLSLFTLLTFGIMHLVCNDNKDDIEEDFKFNIHIYKMHSGLFLFLLQELGILSFAYAIISIICKDLEYVYTDFYNFMEQIPSFVNYIAAGFILIFPIVITILFYKKIELKRRKLILLDDNLTYLTDIYDIYDGKEYKKEAENQYMATNIKNYKLTPFNIIIYGDVKYEKHIDNKTSFSNLDSFKIPRSFLLEKKLIRFLKIKCRQTDNKKIKSKNTKSK